MGNSLESSPIAWISIIVISIACPGIDSSGSHVSCPFLPQPSVEVGRSLLEARTGRCLVLWRE